jgi:hypothetical protein
MVNSFGPGNQKNPPKPPNSKGVKKNINPLANTPMGGTPAANPMGGAQMDFDMPDMSGMGDMGGMQMNAPSPTGGGDGGYENFMMGMTAINGEQPSGANVIKSPEGPIRAGDWRKELPGVAGMSSMGAQPTGMAGFSGAQSPQVAGWNDPAMGGFQMDTPMMNDPMMGGMQMGQPDMGEPFMGDPVMGQQGQFQQKPPAGQQPPAGQGRPIPSPFEQNKAAYERWMLEQTAPMRNLMWDQTNYGWDITRKLAEEANRKTDKDKKKKPSGRRPTFPGRGSRSSFAGGQAPSGSQAGSSVAPAVSAVGEPAVEPAVAPTVSRPPTGVSSAMPPAVKDESGNWTVPPDWQSGKLTDTPEPGIDPRYVSKSATPADDAGEKTELEPGRNYGTDPDPRAVGPPMVTPKDKPALEEFKDKVDAGEVSDEEPAASTEPVSEGAMMDERNWDTVDGEYKFMGADYHKQNTRPETDTKDWEETREEAAEDIKEGDKFSEVGDAAYGTASSKSRSVPLEAELPRTGKIHTNRTTMESYNDLGERVDPITGQVIDAGEGGTTGNWGGSFAGTPPPISLPPTQPQTDADYYNKLVNPDKFQNPIIPDLPAGYGSQRVEDGDEFHKFEGGEYDVDPKEIFTEEGEPIMPLQGIDSNAGGMTVADARRQSVSPAQIQALVNNEVANTYQQANQGLGAMTGARPGMSGDIGSYAQQSLGPEVAARMAAGQAQIDIPWQYAMQHADQVRQRRDLAHKLGLEEAGMITGDYYDYLGDKMGYADTDNQIMRQMYGEMPDAFG